MRGIPTSAFLLLGTAVLAAARAEPVRTGPNAFGDWRKDAPGVVRLIRPADLQAPYETRSRSNSPSVTARPAGAVPRGPAGTEVAVFADGLSGPRILRTAPNGDVFVAETGGGNIRVLRPAADEKAPAANEVFASGLDGPFGIAFWPPGPAPRYVYVGETGRVVRYPYRPGDLRASGPAEVIVPTLPEGGHSTRDVAFSPDGARMYVSVGSGSNASAPPALPAPRLAALEAASGRGADWGDEQDRADVLLFDPQGRTAGHFANGLRNCVGLAVQPDGTVMCAVNERDGLGDNLPPDYVTRVRPGGFYGWPWYYIGAHEDPRSPGRRPDLAGDVLVPDVLIQPHSAPLGITLYDGAMFPWRGDALVALHGSWNRGTRTGYKVVRVPMRDGAPTGEYEDVLTGFVRDDNSVWGRPVGVTALRDGSVLVSEDGNDTIWRMARW
ncbi:MAG: PQQ-dependent sugar dehydrogenase [Janthinobacterium lividum]